MLKALCEKDGSWQALKDQWREQCAKHGEDFDSYGTETFSVLNPLAADGHQKAAVYGFMKDDECQMICEVNHTMLPGYDGYVLRVRNMTYSPKLDFEDRPVDEYGLALVGVFGGVLALSYAGLLAQHIKFHLRSPADRSFFQALSVPLSREVQLFDRVGVTGAWLYVTKRL